MKEWSGLLVLAMSLLSVGGTVAQERDAQVVAPGQLRFSAGAEYQHVAEWFGGRAAVAPDRLRLTPERLPTLQPVSAALADFFAATAEGGTGPADTSELSAGDLSLDVAWTTRTLPLRLAVGILPRVQLGIGVGIVHHERMPRGIELGPGNVGVNPDPAGNAELLARIDPESSDLGSAPVLPLGTSPLGEALQLRVFSATGENLALPDTALGLAELGERLDVLAPPRLIRYWQAEHLEVDAKVELLRSFGEGLYPPAGGRLGYRAAVGAGIRFPFDFTEPHEFSGGWGPGAALPGARVEGMADLFFADRVWLSGGGAIARFSDRQVQVAISPTEVILPGGAVAEVRRSAGTEVEFWVVPRLRLTREISVGGAVRSQHRAAGADEIAGVSFPVPAFARQSAGFSLRYTTVPAAEAGRAVRPLEAFVGYTAAVRDSGGANGGSLAFLQVSLFRSLWGRPTEPR